jgi:hypothetical protein
MNFFQALFLCFTLHLTFGAENNLLNSDLRHSVEQVRFLLTRHSYARIECIFADVNSPLASYNDDDLNFQLDHIYNNLGEEELVMLSEFFFKLLLFLQVSSIYQIQNRLAQFESSQDLKFPNLEGHFDWCQHILQIINLTKLKRSIATPKLINELSFEKISHIDLTNPSNTIKFITDILKMNPNLGVEDKEAFKAFLLYFKNILNKLEEDMIGVLNRTNQDQPFNVSGIFSNPFEIDKIISNHHL